MLDPRHVAEHFDEVRAALTRRSQTFAEQLDAVKPLLVRALRPVQRDFLRPWRGRVGRPAGLAG
jgi:hypothetical protein